MIESYDFCRIAIEGGRLGNGAVIFPDRINGCRWRKGGHILSADDVKEIIDAKPRFSSWHRPLRFNEDPSANREVSKVLRDRIDCCQD